MAPASLSLAGGGRVFVFDAEPQPVALDGAAVFAATRAFGLDGDALFETADAVLDFELEFLALARARARKRTEARNR